MNNKKRIIIAIVVIGNIFSVTTMISCTHKSQVVEVSFSKNIIPIFTAYCSLNSSCHLGANSTNLQLSLDSADAYNALFAKELINTSDPSASLLYAEVNTDEMPLAPSLPLPASLKSEILTWIQQGAKNN